MVVRNEPIDKKVLDNDRGYLSIEISDYEIHSMVGYMLMQINFSLIDTNSRILWSQHQVQMGFNFGRPKTMKELLLNDKTGVGPEFDFAANYIVQKLLSSLPNESKN